MAHIQNKQYFIGYSVKKGGSKEITSEITGYF